MDFEKLLNELKASLVEVFGEKWQNLNAESEKDIEQFLNDSKFKLKRWTELLVDGSIDLDDFEWLVKSQKDLLFMHSLKTVGVNKISLGHFKNKVLATIIEVVKVVVL